MKQPRSGLVSGIVGMRLAHADNHIMLLMITPVAIVTATVADVSSKVAAVEPELSPVLKRFAFVAAADVTPDLTPVSVNLAPVGANLPGIAPDLRFRRSRGKSNECCTCQNLRNHCVSPSQVSFRVAQRHAISLIDAITPETLMRAVRGHCPLS